MIICVVGPTGVGKTKMSIKLAKIFNGEIINADSMQVYKELDIGTAKVKPNEKCGIKHHLFDIREGNDDYSVYDYQSDARKKIDEILASKKVPILVGGTGYYIKAALYDYVFLEEMVENDYSNLSDAEIYERILKYECGVAIDKNNRKRNERLLTKLEMGTFQNQDFKLIYDDVYFVGLTTNRDELYKRIDQRVMDMLVELIDEVKPFYLNNVRSKAIMNGIGYKEFYPFFENKSSLKDCVEKVKQNSRNYAKRQYTWFLNQMDVKWFSVDYQDFDKTVLEVSQYITNENDN